MRRASSSIIANIAEGYGKRNLSEYLHYISIAINSCNELEVFLLLSKDLNYLNKKDFNNLMNSHIEITKMLLGLRKALEIKNKNSITISLTPPWGWNSEKNHFKLVGISSSYKNKK